MTWTRRGGFACCRCDSESGSNEKLSHILHPQDALLSVKCPYSGPSVLGGPVQCVLCTPHASSLRLWHLPYSHRVSHKRTNHTLSTFTAMRLFIHTRPSRDETTHMWPSWHPAVCRTRPPPLPQTRRPAANTTMSSLVYLWDTYNASLPNVGKHARIISHRGHRMRLFIWALLVIDGTWNFLSSCWHSELT